MRSLHSTLISELGEKKLFSAQCAMKGRRYYVSSDCFSFSSKIGINGSSLTVFSQITMTSTEPNHIEWYSFTILQKYMGSSDIKIRMWINKTSNCQNMWDAINLWSQQEFMHIIQQAASPQHKQPKQNKPHTMLNPFDRIPPESSLAKRTTKLKFLVIILHCHGAHDKLHHVNG